MVIFFCGLFYDVYFENYYVISLYATLYLLHEYSLG